jgi:D-alanine-D-alanine ligase-like ATP-grasp enzyme
MNLIPERFRPNIQFCLSEIYNKKFNFPIIIKPKICSGDGNDIEIIKTSKDLKLFLKKLENKKQNLNNYLVQNYLYNYTIEIGILYEKLPFKKEGKIIEIIEKTHKDEIKEYSNYDVKYHNHLINDKLNKLFNNLSKKIPNMNVARYDIRLKSIDDLMKGKFKIIEINGTMGFPFDTPTSNYKYILLNKIIDISIELRWYFARIFIGILNILTLNGYSLVNLIKAMIQSYQNVYNCDDWENIFSLYS